MSKLAATEVSIRFLKKETCGSLIDSISSPVQQSVVELLLFYIK